MIERAVSVAEVLTGTSCTTRTYDYDIDTKVFVRNTRAQEEEGEYEYISDYQGAGNGKGEAHIEPAVLYQPLGEATSDDSFGDEWRRILIEYGSRCEQYGGHWSGHRCVGVRSSRPSPAAKYIEKCVAGTASYGIVGVLVDAVKVSPAGAAVSCFLGELAP
jgi:hypothetical protein